MPPVKKAKAQAKTPKKEEPVKEETKVISGQLEKKIKNQKKKEPKAQRGVVFIKHLPHGFFEEQMQKYFEQFGKVTRLRLARSKRTGGSKGYAFVEFEYPEVAQVAAETMDNYLMFKKLVKAAYIPPEKQIYNYFKTKVRKVKNKAGKYIYVSGKTTAIQRKVKKLNNWNEDATQKRTASQLNKIKKLKEKYAHLGIDFSKIIVEPKVLSTKEHDTANAADMQTTDVAASSLKRKTTNDAKAKSGKKSKDKLDIMDILGDKKSKDKLDVMDILGEKKSKDKLDVMDILGEKKSKDKLDIVDLLGETINDDSEDEDYIAMSESDEEEDDKDLDAETSDEDAYGFAKLMSSSSDDEQSDDDDSATDVDEEEEDEDEETPKKSKSVESNKKSKLLYSKPAKASKVDRFEQLVKRKPKTGGIQKVKSQKKQPATTVKKQMLLDAAKALATKQTSLKAKTNNKSKSTVVTKTVKNKKKS